MATNTESSHSLIDFKEIPPDGDMWEMFARDFLQGLGYYIESQPNRGSDGGKDILVSEQIKGILNTYRMKWLVSCKHNASSGKSVSGDQEKNVLERINQFGADGFIGFYSTIPSSGLNTRLDQLKANETIKDYRIFDARLIENYLIGIGFSSLLMRYLPESYKRVKPIHLIATDYIPLRCAHCGKDLLESLSIEKRKALIGYVVPNGETKKVIDVYWACKGTCDEHLSEYHWKNGASTKWEDISDFMIPLKFLGWVLGIMNDLRNGKVIYTDDAFEKEKIFIMALSQRVLREMTKEEIDFLNFFSPNM